MRVVPAGMVRGSHQPSRTGENGPSVFNALRSPQSLTTLKQVATCVPTPRPLATRRSGQASRRCRLATVLLSCASLTVRQGLGVSRPDQVGLEIIAPVSICSQRGCRETDASIIAVRRAAPDVLRALLCKWSPAVNVPLVFLPPRCGD